MSRPPTAWRGNGSSRCWTSWSRSCRLCDGRWTLRADRQLAVRSPDAWPRPCDPSRPTGSSRRWPRWPGPSPTRSARQMVTCGGIPRAYVNDGGDIALYLTPGETLEVGPGARPRPPRPARQGHDPRGRRRPRGRDQRAARPELLARHRRRGDRAGRLGRPRRRRGHADRQRRRPARDHPAIRRVPARDLDPDSDLGARPVTTEVGALTANEVARRARASGARGGRADARRRPDRRRAVLCLDDQVATVATPVLASAVGG